MTEPPTPQQLDSLAAEAVESYRALPREDRDAELDRIRRLLSALESQGWELARRTDRTTFEMAQWAFLRIEANIAAATPRAVIILSLHGILLSGAFFQGKEILSGASDGWRTPLLLLLVGFFLSATAVLWMVLGTVRPRVAKPAAARSLVFFGSISRQDLTEFVRDFEGADRSRFVRELVEEVHALAGLAAWKHQMFVRAFRVVLYLELPLMALFAVVSWLR